MEPEASFQVHKGQPIPRPSAAFLNKPLFTVRSWETIAQAPSWRTTPYQLSATAYWKYS